jgi:dTDP-4-dehydrorhamnose 3,5-epimerase
MLFKQLKISGLWLIEPEKLQDERGYFARTFCHDSFLRQGLCTDFVQWSVSFNARKGTLRGLHLQASPYEEIKLVTCARGAIFDVAVDIRPNSSTRGQWVGVELSAGNRSTIYIPAGFAHGFQTLTDDVEVSYYISERYHSDYARGVRWDDPDIAIAWPNTSDPTISSRDLALPRLRDIQ